MTIGIRLGGTDTALESQFIVTRIIPKGSDIVHRAQMTKTTLEFTFSHSTGTASVRNRHFVLGLNSSFIVPSWGLAISRVVKAAKQTSNPRLQTTCHFLPFLSQIHNLVRDGVSASTVTLLSDGELDTLALRQRDPGLVLANDENVALTGSEAVVNGILDVDDVETTVVALTVSDDTNTTHVTTTSNHNNGAGVELNEVGDLASGELNLDSVVDLDQRVRVADARELSLAQGLGRVHTTVK